MQYAFRVKDGDGVLELSPRGDLGSTTDCTWACLGCDLFDFLKRKMFGPASFDLEYQVPGPKIELAFEVTLYIM